MRREWIEMCVFLRMQALFPWSPSMRREWIEMYIFVSKKLIEKVSLHAEGVD